MSIFYEMTVTITGYKPIRKDKVIEAAMAEWEIDDFFDSDTNAIQGTGQSNLCGGESEEEFADRIAAAIWKANKGPCEVEVHATYMENLPCDTHTRGAKEYAVLMKSKKGKK